MASADVGTCGRTGHHSLPPYIPSPRAHNFVQGGVHRRGSELGPRAVACARDHAAVHARREAPSRDRLRARPAGGGGGRAAGAEECALRVAGAAQSRAWPAMGGDFEWPSWYSYPPYFT